MAGQPDCALPSALRQVLTTPSLNSGPARAALGLRASTVQLNRSPERASRVPRPAAVERGGRGKHGAQAAVTLLDLMAAALQALTDELRVAAGPGAGGGVCPPGADEAPSMAAPPLYALLESEWRLRALLSFACLCHEASPSDPSSPTTTLSRAVAARLDPEGLGSLVLLMAGRAAHPRQERFAAGHGAGGASSVSMAGSMVSHHQRDQREDGGVSPLPSSSQRVTEPLEVFLRACLLLLRGAAALAGGEDEEEDEEDEVGARRAEHAHWRSLVLGGCQPVARLVHDAFHQGGSRTLLELAAAVVTEARASERSALLDAFHAQNRWREMAGVTLADRLARAEAELEEARLELEVKTALLVGEDARLTACDAEHEQRLRDAEAMWQAEAERLQQVVEGERAEHAARVEELEAQVCAPARAIFCVCLSCARLFPFVPSSLWMHQIASGDKFCRWAVTTISPSMTYCLLLPYSTRRWARAWKRSLHSLRSRRRPGRRRRGRWRSFASNYRS